MPPAESRPEGFCQYRDEAAIGAEKHHALDADVDHAGLFGDLLAEASQQQRHAGRNGAEQQRR
jgi:hypothetical protein